MIDELKRRLEQPTGRGLADAVSRAIRDGVLVEGDKLPAIRPLASGLAISPTTVSAAWALLIRAGAIRTDGRRGTVVAGAREIGPKRYRRALERGTRLELDLSTGVADTSLLPELGASMRSAAGRRSTFSYLDDPVLPELVEVLRADWPYPAESFLITDGAMDAQDLIASTLLRFGDRVVVEHPCFPPLLDLLESLGIRFVGVPVDAHGLVVEALSEALESDVRAIFLQPRAHNPTGASMTPERAAELAAVLAGTDAMVIEDDSNGAISTTAPISLGAQLPERTLHVRSFSKSHGPDLRIAALSGPAGLLERIGDRRLLGQGWTSRLLQSILLDLLTREAAVERVRRARTAYAHRRSSLVRALADEGIRIGGDDGLNIWLSVADETGALIRLASRGIGAAAGAPFSSIATSDSSVRVTAGLLRSDFQRVAGELAAAARSGPSTGLR